MFKKFLDKINPFSRPRPARRPLAEEDILSEDSEHSSDSYTQSAQYLHDLSATAFAWNYFSQIFDGEKYPGGLNIDSDFFYIDYWTLRDRSYRLFTENRYARGLIQRLLTNEIHRGLILEATPDQKVLGLPNDFLNDWADNVEARFDIWAKNPNYVSYNSQRNFGQIQRDIRKTALLSGDVLIVLRQDEKTGLPLIQLVDGAYVRTPFEEIANKNIRHGVEFDEKGKHVAYHVQDGSDPFKKSIRIPAFGLQSGRRVAWMVYGHRIKIDDARGMPALGIILQGLKELDRYSDAEQRSAVLNAIQAFFIKKSKPGAGTRPVSGGAVRYDTAGQNISATASESREYNIARHMPGMILDTLAEGEEPMSFNTSRPNVNYGKFEEALMASFAFANEIPPNIYRLAFSSNYSASGAEINELKMYLDRVRSEFAADFTEKFYKEWLISMVLINAISAPELLEAWRNPRNIFEAGAWLSSEWAGAIKPSLRRIQDIKAYVDAIKEGLSTRDMACKEMWGRKYTTIIRRLQRENEEYVKGIQPLIDAGLTSVSQNEMESQETTDD